MDKEEREKDLRRQWLALKTEEIVRRYGSQSDAGNAIANLTRGAALGNWRKGEIDPIDQSLRVISGLARELGLSLDELAADMQNFVDKGMGRPPSKPVPLSEIRRLHLEAWFNPLTGALDVQSAGVSIGEPEQPDFDITLPVKATKGDRLSAFGRIFDRSIVIWCRLHQVDYRDNRAVSEALAEIVPINPERLALMRAGLVEPTVVGGEIGHLVSIGLYRNDGTRLTLTEVERILGIEHGKKGSA